MVSYPDRKIRKGGDAVRKALIACVCIIIIVSLAVPAYAAAGITGGSFTAAVSPEGNCQVTLDLQLHLDGNEKEVTFPLPGNARGITVNGSPARTNRGGGLIHVKLVQGNTAGDFTFRLQYTLPEVVTYGEENKYLLTLPILSGFNYPVRDLKFSVQLPGEYTARPDFISGYYQQTIESSIDYTRGTDSLSGTVNTELKDRELLTMTLVVPGDQYPNTHSAVWAPGPVEAIMAVCAALALLYWLLFLRCAPILPQRVTVPPEGYNAGELSGILNGIGGDLTMMVFSWARLGYILIQYTDTGRVMLHKRMEMGNERDAEEMRLFKSLFGKRRYVDGTGYHYAQLCRKAAAMKGSSRHLYHKATGNPRIFRLLCAGVGFFGGVSLARAMVGEALLGVLLIGLLAVFGGVSGWLMQDWVRGLHLRDRFARRLGLILLLVWLLLGFAGGVPGVALFAAGAQLLAGIGYAYGGRRNPVGRQTVAQLLGLRRYLKRLSPKEAQTLLRRDPDYFFTMLPYALALGVEKPFAKSFRGKQFPPCSYLTAGIGHRMTAQEWAQLMSEVAAALDAQQKRLVFEKLFVK